MRDLLGKYGCDRNATLLVSKWIRTYILAVHSVTAHIHDFV